MGNKPSSPVESPWASVARNVSTPSSVPPVDDSDKSVSTKTLKLAGVLLNFRILGETCTFTIKNVTGERVLVLVNGTKVGVVDGKDSLGEFEVPKEAETRVDVRDDADTKTLRLHYKNGVLVTRTVLIGDRVVDLHDVYGLAEIRECVVCLCDQSDTSILPCRHLCVCRECADRLMQARPGDRKCPVCRALVVNLLTLDTKAR